MKSLSSSFMVLKPVADEHGSITDVRIVYADRRCARADGPAPEDLRGRSVLEVLPAVTPGWFEVCALAADGAPRDFELTDEAAGARCACRAHRPWPNSNHVCVVCEDVVEDRGAAELIETLASQQRAILNTVPMALALFKNRVVQWANPAFARTFGYEPSEFAGLEARALYVEQEEYERIGRDGYGLMASGAVFSGEVRMKRRDGRPISCHLTGQSVDPKHPEAGSIWVLHDITEQKRLEDTLRQERPFADAVVEERLNRLVEHLNDMVIVLDDKGTIRSVIGPVEAILAYPPEALQGREAFSLVHPDDAEACRESFRDALTHPGVHRTIEYRVKHRDGHWVPLEAVGANLLDDPFVNGIVLDVRDVTERRRVEEEHGRLQDQLQQAMKMEAVGRLAGGIAHDFNNLLTTITGNIDLARLELRSNDPIVRNLDEVGEAAERAATLTRQLLAFSRRQIIEPRVLNLNDLITNLERMLSRLIGEDIRFETVLDAALGSVLVDPGQFEQVLVNLAVNARDAMPDGGTLVIETANVRLDEEYCARHPGAQAGPHVLLAVSDTGQGMSADVKARLFEPFFTTKPTGRGTGLGLATTFGTVKQAGGSIQVYSEVGIGTTFKIYLPTVKEAAEPLAAERSPLTAPGGSETILVVEDESSVRELALRLLRRLGYQVLQAANAAEALALAEGYTGRIDLLMTDVVMPGMNGRELAAQLNALHPETRVLFASGYTENVVVHHGVVDKNLSFIGKPYSLQTLAARVREVVTRK